MAPYVLLDDARPGGTGRLYRAPVEILAAHTVDDVANVLDRVRAGTRRGLHAAGFLGYEAGVAFEPKAGPAPARGDLPLAWFGLFETWEAIDAARWLPDPAGAWLGLPEPTIDRATYEGRVRAALALIAAGDLYQANVSFPTRVPFAGDPLAAYARLRARAGAGHGAVVATGDATILSLSPELFFRRDGDRLACRPMKGTAPPDTDPAALAHDPKNRAENLMIVDLMRNDLARVAVAGSVAVPRLFAVERYPTVLQLVSEVTATLAPGHDAIDVLAATFPCGSITGAPKVRAMQAIAAIEGTPRGVYTGAIGRIDADGDARFGVAIRTLVVQAGADHAELSLGAGIVADSDPALEWEECLAKGAFVGSGRGDGGCDFDLIETMAFDPEEGVLMVERHLERLRVSAARFGFAYDRHNARNELQAATFRLRAPHKVRLVLAPSGAIAIEVAPMPAAFDRPLTVAVVPLPVDPADLRLRHKTSDRGFYDEARVRAGTDEVVFIHDGRVTEGSFTSVFVQQGGVMVTPAAGPLLPGILRESLIAGGGAVEGVVTPDDLANGFLLGNALRGLMPARLAL